jgi:SAM-dependent methyltransferase
MSLAARAEAEELMDADDLPADTYAAVVADLARVNTVTLAARPTLAFLDRATRAARTLRVLDVGFGDGDMLRRIARWAAERGIAAELVGIDLNPRSEVAARAHTPPDAFLRFMEAESARGWLVNDLHRHGFAHVGFPLLATLARWHPIVRHDGTLSIARSYRPGEWPPLLAEADITAARVFRAFPFRLCVERLR